MGAATKTVKRIRIDVDKCTGCRACELICAAYHADPKYGTNSPERARIHVISDPLRDVYVPVYAGDYTADECPGRSTYVIDGKEYDDCGFCRAACPSRVFFHEPDSGIPLKCDMCESLPALERPMCVQWCINEALVYEENRVRS